MELTGLETKILGRNLIHFTEIDSTQLEMWRNDKLENGTIIIADNQKSGIGTHGRKWHKNCRKDVTFSLKVSLNCSINKIENITLEIAEIIKDIFKELYDIEVEIKQPNDIIKNNKKLGGILTQTKVNGNLVKEMVIGIGINLNKCEFPEELKNIATSIENEFNIKTDRQQIITKFCNRFENLLISKKLL